MKGKFLIYALAACVAAGALQSCGKDDAKPSSKVLDELLGGDSDDKINDGNSADSGSNDENNLDDNSGDNQQDLSLWPDYPRNTYKEGTLRAAVNYDEHPVFRLACAVNVSDLTNTNGNVYKVIRDHFDEITFDNAMKYNCIVNSSGQMNFSEVKKGIAFAKAHKITIFGHTLAWHSQQQVTYLQSKVKTGTDEQKKEAIVAEMDKWIDGCMKNCGDYITCWDAINEAISEKDRDNDGYYDLQGYGNASVNNLNKETTNFYWQDYLGVNDYGPIVFNLAREKFQKYGGNPNHLKLFINDYNLESDYDDNKKLKSLIHWIKIWEKDGRCKIDGIGTQMHIHCYANKSINENKKKAITNMFKLMAATGKLCKISELDLGYKRLGNENWQAPAVMSTELTDEEAQQMADLYEFVIKEYFRIIPKEQQFGITHWTIADLPAGGWRGGEAVGLWKKGCAAKWPMFDGFLKGLQHSND